jgi:hypothetical protein
VTIAALGVAVVLLLHGALGRAGARMLDWACPNGANVRLARRMARAAIWLAQRKRQIRVEAEARDIYALLLSEEDAASLRPIAAALPVLGRSLSLIPMTGLRRALELFLALFAALAMCVIAPVILFFEVREWLCGQGSLSILELAASVVGAIWGAVLVAIGRRRYVGPTPDWIARHPGVVPAGIKPGLNSWIWELRDQREGLRRDIEYQLDWTPKNLLEFMRGGANPSGSAPFHEGGDSPSPGASRNSGQ